MTQSSVGTWDGCVGVESTPYRIRVIVEHDIITDGGQRTIRSLHEMAVDQFYLSMRRPVEPIRDEKGEIIKLRPRVEQQTLEIKGRVLFSSEA